MLQSSYVWAETQQVKLFLYFLNGKHQPVASPAFTLHCQPQTDQLPAPGRGHNTFGSLGVASDSSNPQAKASKSITEF